MNIRDTTGDVLQDIDTFYIHSAFIVLLLLLLVVPDDALAYALQVFSSSNKLQVPLGYP